MIRFEKNGNSVTVVEDAAEFKAILNNSIDAAAKLAAGNPYQAIELYTRFNSPGEFAIMISEESFNRIKFGYGYDQNGKSMMIAPILLSNNTVKFLAFIPTDRYPNAGHIIPITVEDGDILSKEPLEDKGKFSDENEQLLGSFARILNSDDPDKTYRRELFTLANKILKDLGVDRKEAFRLAKLQLNQYSNHKFEEPMVKVFKKIPDECKVGDWTKLEKELENDDQLSPLAKDFKQLAEVLMKLDAVESNIMGELKKMPTREKHVNPTPPSLNPLNVILALVGAILSEDE